MITLEEERNQGSTNELGGTQGNCSNNFLAISIQHRVKSMLEQLGKKNKSMIFTQEEKKYNYLSS